MIIKLSGVKIPAALLLLTLTAASTVCTVPATAAAAVDAGQLVTTQVGDRTFYADGTVEVAVDAGTMSLGQCATGQFCVWSQANYMGSFRYKTGTGAKALGGTVGSFWNNRSTVARLYNNDSSASVCVENGAKKASVAASYASAETVSLSSSASC